MIRPIYRFVRSGILHSVIPEGRSLPFAGGKKGIEVVGLFHNATGLGESARLCARQLQEEGYKVRCTSAEKFLLKKHEIDWKFENTASEDEIGLRIIHLNPPMIPPYALRIGLSKFSSIYNIGYWAWELEHLPPEWVKSLSYINAVMAPSEFTCRTVRRYTDKLVLKVPHPVKIDKMTTGIRARLGIKQDDFLITSVFSVQSSLERKNPAGLIEAFLMAFDKTPNAHLVFKISDGREQLLALTQGHPNIHCIEDIWPREDILGLIETSDVYASLHRSEGFGLGMAEAMMLGTPVMATDWSGNADFCTSSNSFPVPYKMVPVQSTHSEFAKAGMSVWAEADVKQAASILRAIYENPDEGKSRAALCMAETNQYFAGPHYQKSFHDLKEKYDIAPQSELLYCNNMNAKKVVLITGHDYESPRKTGFYFWAEVLTARGVDVDWITVGLSRLTFLKKDARSYVRPYNQWINIKPHLKKFVWCPPFHPSNFNNDALNAITLPLFDLYPHFLPQSVKDQVKDADVFIVESGAGPMLVPTLKALCPKARFIYNHSDRANVVKFHPAIPKAEKKTLRMFDWVRTNAAATVEDFDKDVKVHYVPQAIEKDMFDTDVPNPYNQPKNAISVGDMLFDAYAIETLAKKFPDWTFHLFGKKSALDKPLPNVIAHGEVSFAAIVPYIKFADIGLAPYKSSPNAEYLSHSSLKLVQYTYCRLPIVAPHFACIGRSHAIGYDADQIDKTIIPAFEAAQHVDRNSIDRSDVLNWDEFVDRMLAA